MPLLGKFFRYHCYYLLSRVYTCCHSPRIGENGYSLRILTRNHWYGSHLHLSTKRMLRKCKKLFSLPFSRTQNTTFSRERVNNMENTRKHLFTLVIFAIRPRLFSGNTDKCKLSFSMMHVKHYPRRKWREGDRKEHKVETNCIGVWENKKTLRTILSEELSHLRILYQ